MGAWSPSLDKDLDPLAVHEQAAREGVTRLLWLAAAMESGGGHTGSEETTEKSPTLVPRSFLRFDLRVDVESYLETVSCF